MSIPTRIFGRTGRSVSCLGFGGAPMGYLKTERREVGALLNFLLDSGVNVIDTAAVYPGSEEAIGATIGNRRGEYLLVSKCGPRLADISAPVWSEELIRRSVDRSLKFLGTDVIDVMLLHSCDLETLKRGEALGELVKAREAGKIRWVGYSGDNQAAAYAAGLADVAVIETSVSIADQANIELVLPVAREKNVGVLAKRPIANAAWKELSEQPGLYASYSREYHERLKKMGLSPGEMEWPELALRFTLSQPGVHCAIVGTTNFENARRNLETARSGGLPAGMVEEIREAFKRARGEEEWAGLQ